MSHTENNPMQVKAELLLKILEKHPPKETADLAFRLMQKAEPGSDEFKCLAALYEIMGALQ